MEKSMPFCLVASIFCLIILLIFLIIGCFFVAREARKQELREKHARRMQREMLIVGTEMLGMKAPEEQSEEPGITPEKVVVVHMP
ncbi:hypothetical protein PRIPAC_74423 [Pristionchus pacificus]|uniref:Uncharacterized protein n=1 Tax=Pristionchus pacificus TaxID=54126 RepID=A0A2A6B5A1_PRIPA|nr:hypothetical protein PRIPAC_74423 [Pristionchus pacificus]|eukprot:PDM61052.1 hypothetical protein PRIPAC_54858 [Pristionchus pacificus]